MKVIQINALGATLSTGRTTREMHEYFLGHGIESHIATACNHDCGDAYAISTMKKMHIDTAMTVVDGLELYHSRRQTKRFLRYLDTLKPDVVHLRVLHQSFINVGMLLRYLAENDIPTVITLHDFWFMTGKCCYYHNYPCDKWKTGCHHCAAMKDDSRRRLFDRTEKMWKDKKAWLTAIPRLAVVGNSDWTTGQAKESFLKDAKILTRIYNWIDLDVFRPRDPKTCREKLGLPADKKIILGVSSSWTHGDRKGFDDYLKLAEILPDAYRIVLVGAAASDALPSNVSVAGRTGSVDTLIDYYSAADVYLNLSKGETFGKVSAEALACGTPVIAIDATANKELVPEHGGTVVRSADPGVLLDAIKRITDAGKEAYSDVCTAFARKNFEKEKLIREYIDLYAALTGKGIK